MSQETDRPAKRLNAIDVAVIQEAVKSVGKDAECMAVFTVGKDGKPKDIQPGCTVADYDPYVVRAISGLEYQTEMVGGEVFETEGFKQPFKFTGAKAAPVVAPVLETDVDPRLIDRMLHKHDGTGTCAVKLTVAADGSVRDIVPACEVEKLNKPLAELLAKTKYKPGQKDGKPVDMPIERMLKFADKKK